MSKSLVEIAQNVMNLEESDITPKFNLLVESGLVQSSDSVAFKNAYRKLRIGGIETKLNEQERTVIKNLVSNILEQQN